MKKKYIWLFEIIIWLIIFSGIFYFFVYHSAKKENVRNTYYLFFDDVEGLQKGSPVRLMGINIGYVRDVKIFDNKVFISFLVTKDNVQIPHMASASIEFYGLGGSTSLELNPGTSSEYGEKDAIIPVESYRIQDFWDGQELVANVMIDIYGSIGRNIKPADVITYKSFINKSSVLREFSRQTGMINDAQSVIIYKLSESSIDYINKKEAEREMENLSKPQSEQEAEVKTDE